MSALTNIGTATSRFAGCIHPTRNFDMVMLMSAAERFGFIVDARGPYPTMIDGMRAKQYTTHRDMLDFISITFGGTLHTRSRSTDIPNVGLGKTVHY